MYGKLCRRWGEAAHFSPWSSGESCFWRGRREPRRPAWRGKRSCRVRRKASCRRSTAHAPGTGGDPFASPLRFSAPPARTRTRCCARAASPTGTGTGVCAGTVPGVARLGRRSPGAPEPTERPPRSSGCGSRARRTAQRCCAAGSATSGSVSRRGRSAGSAERASRPRTSPGASPTRPGAFAARRSSLAGARRARRAGRGRAASRPPMRARPG
jgi:hypothetical protein